VFSGSFKEKKNINELMATQKLTWNKLDLSAIDIAPSFYRFVQQMD